MNNVEHRVCHPKYIYLECVPAFSVEPFSNEQYKKIRKEMDALKDDNERLRRRKDELEMLFEHANVKDAYNIPKYKVCTCTRDTN